MSAWERIEQATGVRFERTRPRSEATGLALETLLARTPAREDYARAIEASGAVGDRLLRLLGASRLAADILNQNPELITLLLEPEPEGNLPDLVAREAALGLRAARSYRQALDRLRYVRQWSLLRILDASAAGQDPFETAKDLAGTADALLMAARDAAWREVTREGPCPLTVIAFGKLGGQELNLASDIDLAYVLPDGIDEPEERELLRFCEEFGRALEEPMGRGFLYRTDFRLRPYGARGRLASSMRAHEAYYRNYAEGWEVQALLRSRPIFGPMVERWEAMRRQILGTRKWGGMAIEELMTMRARTEAAADPLDLKRGSGGIRDAEWIAQIGTLLAGAGAPDFPRHTVGALERLGAEGRLSSHEVEAVSEAYRTLRAVEHAVQARSGQQTHNFPEDADGQEAVAALLGWPNPVARIEEARARTRTVYAARLWMSHGDPVATTEGVSEFLRRFDPRYVVAAEENEGSADRIAQALAHAPLIMQNLRDTEVLEALISGEIREESPRRELSEITDWVAAASQLRRDHARAWLRFALYGVAPEGAGRAVSVAFEGAGLAVFLLGSHALGTEGPDSDADLLLLRADDDSAERAERAARDGLRRMEVMRREGAPASFDLRLRPEGGKGALVHSLRSFRRYDEEAMAGWERVALVSAFPIAGTCGEELSGAACEVIRDAAQARAEVEWWRELLAVKDRVEGERSQGVNDSKLGPGGIMDAEWANAFAAWGVGKGAPAAAVAAVVAARRRQQLGGRGDMLLNGMAEQEMAAIRAAWLAARRQVEARTGFKS